MRGSKRERKPGVWELRAGGHSRTVHVKGARAADRELRTFVSDVEAGKLTKAKASTVAELLEGWLRDRRRDWAPRTYSENRAFVDRYLAPRRAQHGIGDLHPDRVTARDLRRLYAHLGDKVGAPTARRAHTHLSSAFRDAVRHDELAANPCDKVRPPKLPPRPERDVSLADVLTVLAEAERRAADLETTPRERGQWAAMATIIVTAIATGARQGEIAALRWRDIDLNAGTVRIAAALTVDEGKVVVKSTKTGKSAIVAIGPKAADALAQWKRRCTDEAAALGVRLAPGAFVWAQTPDGVEPRRPDGISTRWITLRDAVGQKGLRFHDIRHASGSYLLSEGLGLGEVARRQNHSPAMLAGRYAHGDEQREAEAARLLDRMLP